MKDYVKNNNFVILGLLTIATALLFIVSSYTAYVVLQSEAGVIHELNIKGRIQTGTWYGMYGIAVMEGSYIEAESFIATPGLIEYKDLTLKCFDLDGIELYLSTKPKNEINTATIRGATHEEVDAFIGYTYDNETNETYDEQGKAVFDGAFETFTTNFTIDIGGKEIDVIGGYLNSYQENVFRIFPLYDPSSDAIVFGTSLVDPARGFDDRFVTYQIMVPVPKNKIMQEYYLFGDPADMCVDQEGMGTFFKGYIRGYVRDNETNAPLSNVMIVLGGNTTYTDQDGFYSMTLPQGGHVLGAFLEGYADYFDIVTIPPLQVLVHDFFMTRPEPIPSPSPDRDEPIPPRIESPREIYKDGIWIAPRIIEKTISIDSFSIEQIGLFNAELTTAQLNFAISGNVSQMIKLGNETIFLGPRESTFNQLTFYGYELGYYEGNLTITGTTNATILIKLWVVDEDLGIRGILINLDLLTPAYIGKEARFKTSVTNLLRDKQYPVKIDYYLEGEENDITPRYIGSEEFFLKDTHASVSVFSIPNNYSEGFYMLKGYAQYLDQGTTAKTLVPVTYPPHTLLTLKIFGNMPLWLFLILLGLAFWVFMYFFNKVKNNIKSKKRFDAKMHYNTLPSRDEPSSIFIGKLAETNRDAFFDMNKLTVHSIIAGSTGGGKSISAQVIVEECLKKNVAVLVFDPTAQWSSMIRKCEDPQFLSLYEQFGMKQEEAKAFTGNVRAVKNAKEVLNLMDYIKPGEIQVFTATTMEPEEYDTFVANTIREMFHANLQEHPELRILFVYDEIHRILPKFGGAGNGYIQIERACREFRKWGIGIILISQVLADFVGDIKANINTEIQMKTRDEGDLDRIKMKFGESFVQGLVKAPVGSGMLQNSAFNRGKPYYVTFRPILHSTRRLSDEELDKYNDANDKIDQIKYELSQLRENDKDTFDLELELKLALDKVKSGNFNMVNIYLESLESRLSKMWTALGKKPKKLKKEFIDEDAFDDVIEQAKKAREAFMKGNVDESTEESIEEKNTEIQTPSIHTETEIKKKEELNKDDEEKINEIISGINDAKEKFDAIKNKGSEEAINLLGEIAQKSEQLPSDVKKDNEEFFNELSSLKNNLTENELNDIINNINNLKVEFDKSEKNEKDKILEKINFKILALPDSIKEENKEFFDEIKNLAKN